MLVHEQTSFGRKFGCTLVFCLLCCCQLQAATLWGELEKVDDLRAARFDDFSDQLKDLELKLSSASTTERHYFQLLKAYQFALSSNYDQAYYTLKPLVSTSVEPNLRQRAIALSINALALSHNYQDAFSYLNELSQAEHEKLSPRAFEHVVGVLALVYNQLSMFESALFFAAQLEEGAYTDKARCHAKFLTLEAQFGLGAWDILTEQSQAASDFCADVGEVLYQFLILNKYQEMLIKNHRYDEAIKLFFQHRDGFLGTHYPILIAQSKALTAQAFLHQQQFQQAEDLSASALEIISHRTEFNQALITTYQVLSQLAELQQNYQQALSYYKELSRLQTAYRDDIAEQQLAFQLARAQVSAKNQQIELLSKDNQLLHLQQQVMHKEAQNARLLLGLFVLLLLVLGFLAYQGLMGRHRFKFMAENDELTGISNRYHFNKLAEKSLHHCQKQGMTVGVILFDLDHFKQINDKFGHATGDWVLQQVVQSCRNFMRLDDVFGRLGGEEFAIILPGCHADKALMLAEICRDSIQDIDTTSCGHEFLLTASFGVTSSDISGFELKQLLADADLAMYQAKQGGRNKVHFFTGSRQTQKQA